MKNRYNAQRNSEENVRAPSHVRVGLNFFYKDLSELDRGAKYVHSQTRNTAKKSIILPWENLPKTSVMHTIDSPKSKAGVPVRHSSSFNSMSNSTYSTE